MSARRRARTGADPMSRRAFLLGTGAVVGGAALVGGAGWAGVRAWADGSAAAGAPGFFEPAVRASQGGRLDTTLRVTRGPASIATQDVLALTYEGTYPGPTLDLKAGEHLSVHLINDDPEQPTNLHTHGLHVSPRRPSDDVLLDVPAGGGRFPYRFDLPADHPGGTYWYHAHRHLISDEQVFGGLFGLLIVRGELDELPGVAGLEERVLMLSQMEVRDGAVVPGDASPLPNQVTLVNGRYQPGLVIEAGQTQRWRILNVGPTFLRVDLSGRPFHVIATDGNALPAPRQEEVLVIPPGARVDALVQGAEPGTAQMRSLSWEELGPFYNSMVPVPQVLAQVEVRGAAVAPDPLPHHLLPFTPLPASSVVRRRTFRLEEREPRHTGDLDGFRYFINGVEFDHDVVNETMVLGDTEDWEFVNLTYEPHPLHIHVNPFQVVEVGGSTAAAEDHLRDTVLVPPFSTLTIRHRFEDFTGKYPVHCHLLFHEDHGMMQLLEVVDPGGTPEVGRSGPPPSHH